MGNSCAAPKERENDLYVPFPKQGGLRQSQGASPSKDSAEQRSHLDAYSADSAQAVRTAFAPAEPGAPVPLMTVPASGAEDGGSWIGRVFSQKGQEKPILSVGDALAHFYSEKLLPIEAESGFHVFHSPQLPPAYFSARPLILTLGQYSTGKTSFIRHLIENDYPGQQIGPEPTTDRFVAVCHGEEVQKIPGNALVYDQNFPFTPLSAFGNGFLCRLECARVPSSILEGVTFIDTPGVLSGEKQRLKRGYDFEEVIAWFVEHAAMIILFFDAHKLDISDEFKRCIAGLSGSSQKVQILLNKADRMTTQQLMRVHGALMWALGKVVGTPEVARVYVGSFWDEPLDTHELSTLFQQEKEDLYTQIQHLPRSATVQKMNDLSKRARLAKAHALLLDHLRNAMPSLWGRVEQQEELIRKLPATYLEVSRQHNVPLGDFPDVETMQAKLAMQDFTKFVRLDRGKLEKLDALLSTDIPALLRCIPLDDAQ
mmetsp:Transcript_1157/g.3229  ORF Transcript_1157/g.3229 Transcript_1157/m.3229 type:complete len:484 (+) Transcript_1157:66-1517(+)